MAAGRKAGRWVGRSLLAQDQVQGPAPTVGRAGVAEVAQQLGVSAARLILQLVGQNGKVVGGQGAVGGAFVVGGTGHVPPQVLPGWGTGDGAEVVAEDTAKKVRLI